MAFAAQLCIMSQALQPLTVPGMFLDAAFPSRAFARNMDGEAVERSIQEATSSVQEHIAAVERSLHDLEEHTRCAVSWLTCPVLEMYLSAVCKQGVLLSLSGPTCNSLTSVGVQHIGRPLNE